MRLESSYPLRMLKNKHMHLSPSGLITALFSGCSNIYSSLFHSLLLQYGHGVRGGLYLKYISSLYFLTKITGMGKLSQYLCFCTSYFIQVYFNLKMKSIKFCHLWLKYSINSSLKGFVLTRLWGFSVRWSSSSLWQEPVAHAWYSKTLRNMVWRNSVIPYYSWCVT